jgi:hypothetical protein
MNRSLGVEKNGRVFVYRDLGNSDERRETAPGWGKEWFFENVYGWAWVGPMDVKDILLGKRWQTLIVLNHEPDVNERRAIEAYFSDAPTPDGGPMLLDPFDQ